MRTAKRNGSGKGSNGAKRHPKSDTFPMETFRELLRRYCRENFSATDIEKDASGANPYIGVCIGDDCGGKDLPIIFSPSASEMLAGKGAEHV